MGTLALRVAVAVAPLLVGCAANRNKHFDAQLAVRVETPKQVAAGSASETKRWLIGQWASYKTTNAGRTVSFEHIRVVGDNLDDSCIEWIHDTEAERTKWFVCLRWEPNATNDWRLTKERIQAVIRVSSDDPTPRLWNFSDGRRTTTLHELLRGHTHNLAIHAGQVIPAGISEPVAVPAGDFMEASRTSYEGYELWSHPDVPFGGFVKSKTRTGGWERVLIAYGASAATADTTSHDGVFARARETCPAVAAACTLPVRSFLALGWGVSAWTETADVETRGGPLVTVQLGQRVRPGLHVVEEADIAYGGNAMLDEARGALLVGIRWTPFRRDRGASSRRPSFVVPTGAMDLAAVHVKASVGASNRSVFRYDTEATESTWAPSARAALGWLPMQGGHWAFGVEYRYQLARISGDYQRDWAFVVLTQVSD